ncbi:hypothetical protein ACJX0J_008504 [Zea mays]
MSGLAYSLIDGLCRENKLLEAISLLNDMIESGVQANAVPFTILIDKHLRDLWKIELLEEVIKLQMYILNEIAKRSFKNLIGLLFVLFIAWKILIDGLLQKGNTHYIYSFFMFLLASDAFDLILYFCLLNFSRDINILLNYCFLLTLAV